MRMMERMRERMKMKRGGKEEVREDFTFFH
jgi:hypothetical protein